MTSTTIRINQDEEHLISVGLDRVYTSTKTRSEKRARVFQKLRNKLTNARRQMK